MRLQQELTVMSQLVPGDGSGLKYLATTGQLSEILALWCDEDVYIINPICGWMSRTCSEVFKNSWHLYVSHTVSILSVGVWLEGKTGFLTPSEKIETVCYLK